MKTSISDFKQITSTPFFNYSFFILLLFLLGNINAKCQEHCLVIKNIGINIEDGINVPNCDGSFTNGCQPSEFIELFNTCNTNQPVGCYIVCDGDWCFRIPSTTPDLSPGGTLVLGSEFSPGFDDTNPFHVNIHNCTGCTSFPQGGSPFADLGIFVNTNEQAVLYNSSGDLEMGVYWGGGQEPFGNLEIMFDDACSNQNLTIDFPDPNGSPKFIDLGDLAEIDACAISIPCAIIDDNSVNTSEPIALCVDSGQDAGIGGSNPYTQIGPLTIQNDVCFYDNSQPIQVAAYFEPQNIIPDIIWTSNTGAQFYSANTGIVNTINGPTTNLIFPTPGNHSVTIALENPDDCYTYYYTEEFFVEKNADLSNLGQVCVGNDFTIIEAPSNFNFDVIIVSNNEGNIFAPPQTALPANFSIPGVLSPGIYSVMFLEQNNCIVSATFEVLGANQCQTGCDDPCFAEYDPTATGTEGCISDSTPSVPNIPLPDAICGENTGFIIMNQQPTFVWFSNAGLTNQVYAGNDFNPFTDGDMADIPGETISFWVVDITANGCQSPATEVDFRIWDSAAYGCTDPAACNYDSLAKCDDDTCQPVPVCNTNACAGDLEIIDPANLCACVVSEVQVLGCTNNMATNYNPNANCDDPNDPCDFYCTDPGTCDDGNCTNGVETWDTATCSCVSNPIDVTVGCTNPNATNYDPNAICDDGTCDLISISILGACNCNSPDHIDLDGDGQIDLLRDTIRIIAPTGDVWTFSMNADPPVLDANGTPIAAGSATASEVSSGVYDLIIYHPADGTGFGSIIMASNENGSSLGINYRGCECTIIASCTNEPGLMQSSSSMVCGGRSIFVREVFSVVDELSTKAYIMHQSKVFDGQNYITIQNNGRFVSPGAEYHNQPVYISAVVGPPGADGLPIMDNPCTVWTPYGAYIVFFDPVNISVVNETCLENQYYVDVEITGGVGGRSSNRAYRTVSDGYKTYQNVDANEVLQFGPYEDQGSYTIKATCAKNCTGSLTEVIPCGVLLRMLDYSLNADIIKVAYTNANQQIQSIEIYNLNAQQIPIEVSIDRHQGEVRLLSNEKGLYVIKVLTKNNEVDFLKVLN